ncbi:MAG: S41 family peptidase [Eubacteriales bacterium]|nr:S41 family peptidase [Eubacteriales bacterium]
MDNKRRKNSLVSHVLTAVVAVLITLAVVSAAQGILLKNSPSHSLPAGIELEKSHSTGERQLKNGKSGEAKQENFGPIWDQFDYDHSLKDIFEGHTDLESYKSLGRLLDVYALLKDEYYRDLTDQELLEAMLKGLCNNQDSQYTFYLSPEENEQVHESNSGEYSGIGAIVQQKDGIFQISDIVDNSPAAESGLRIGDQFVSVDGVEVAKFSDVSQLAAEVRGETGTKVELVVYRPSEKKELSFSIKRKKIKNANLRSDYLEDGIGYIRIVEFNSGVAKNFKREVENLEAKGAKALIIDLRNNPGGYVREVTEILDYMLPEGLLATARGRRGGEDFSEEWRSSAKQGLSDEFKYYILVNEYSASASELMSGVLQDWERGVVIGRQSWGKGVGSVSFDLDDGSGVQVTNFHYYLPKGVCIQDIGVTPDIEIEMPEELQGLSVSQIDRAEDPDLQKALELAREDLGE